MNEKLLEIREMMDTIHKTPLILKATLIERVAEKQYELMEMIVKELENGKQ